MKLAIGVAIIVWLLCGLIGDWMLEGREDMHLKRIARGPITLAEAFNEKPVRYPEPT